MALTLITPASEFPISVADLKQHLRVDFADDDTIIETYLRAAVAFGERFTGRAFMRQTWELTLDEFPDNEIRIPYPPLISVTSVKYDDASGAEQTLSGSDYTVDSASQPGWIVPASSWPATFDGINAVRIRFDAGYGDENSPPERSVPNDIVSAIVLRVKADYDNDSNAERLRQSAELLFRLHRVHTGMA